MQKRWLVAAAGAIGAAGAGLLVYRWFVLGFSWSGSGSLVMTIVGAALIFGATTWMRSASADPWTVPWWLRIAAGVPGLAIGAGLGFAIAPTLSHVALTDREAGAVTIALPHGDHESAQGDPVGKIEIEHPGGFELIAGIAWQGGSLDDATAKALVAALAQGLGGSASLVEHDDFVVGDAIAHRTATMSKDGRTGYMTVFACGADTYEVFTFGDGSEGLHRRVLASVRCNAKAGDAPAALPIAFDAPAGWKPQEIGAGQLGWASDDAAVIVRPVAPGNDDDVEKVLSVIGPAIGGSITVGDRRSEGGRTAWSGTMTVDKQTFAALIEAWSCPERSLRLLAMYLHAPGTDEAPGVELLTRVHCARP